MFPFITLRGVKIYMTGLGIVFGLVTFLIAAWVLCRKYRLDFRKLFYRFPTLLIITYLLGSYSYLLIEKGVWFPLSSFTNFKSLLSPYGYKFHFVGILLGIVRSLRKFFKKIVVGSEKGKWMDLFFFSTSVALIPMGVFFTLGDTVIGKPAPFSGLGVTDLTPEGSSALSKYGKVFPVGVFLSLVSLLSLGITFAAKSLWKKEGRGYIGFAILLLLINIVFSYQQYTRHGVVPFLGMSLDIKNFVALAVGIVCLLKGIQLLRRSA